ncbi:hypothetical protein JHK85_046137 [Glycine max]|nr:hypothetical protein JHK85_046137 [Glycine max]
MDTLLLSGVSNIGSSHCEIGRNSNNPKAKLVSLPRPLLSPSRQREAMMSSIRFLWILMVSLTTSCALSQSHKLSAYDVLMEYRFSVGLLPKGAIGYSLNRDNSEFTAYFQEA